MRKVSISSCRVGPLCGETVYINDYRVCGMKPSGSENVTFSASADVSEIFKAINKNLSIEDLKQNEHVKGLLETLREIERFWDCEPNSSDLADKKITEWGL